MRNSSGKSQTRLESSRVHLTKGIIGSLILKNINFQRSLVFKRLGIQWLSANTALALSAKHMEDGRVLHSEDIQNKSKITAKLTLSMLLPRYPLYFDTKLDRTPFKRNCCPSTPSSKSPPKQHSFRPLHPVL
jgi:hypothetical protein